MNLKKNIQQKTELVSFCNMIQLFLSLLRDRRNKLGNLKKIMQLLNKRKMEWIEEM